MADWYFRNRQSGLTACPGCRNLVRTDEEFCPYCARRLGPEKGVRGKIKKLLGAPFLTTRVLLGVLIGIFLLELIADLFLPAMYKQPRPVSLFDFLPVGGFTAIRMGSNFHPLVAASGEYWRLLTSCFLHFSAIHMLFNGYATWTLARLAERFWGGRQVIATFVVTGIFGAAVSYFWGMNVARAANSAGASGAICGIMGLFLGSYYHKKGFIGEQLGRYLIQWAVYVIAFGIFAGADNAAHIGGLVSGAVLGYFLPPANATRNPGRDLKIWTALARISLVLVVICFVFAAGFYFRGPEHALNALMR